MNTSFQFLVIKAKRLAGTAVIAGSLFSAGCASAMPEVQTSGALPPVKAEIVYVYAFDAAADQVKLDEGGMVKKLMSAGDGTSAAQKQQTALAAREQLADTLVQQLQSMGVPAMRVDGPAPAGRNALIIEGQFEKIDAGNRRRRILIGLGAGKSEVGASVAVLYQPAYGTPQPLATFSANADSGHMPGVAETAGIGAAAGQVATSVAVSGGLHGVSEAKHDAVSADTAKLAKSIVKQLTEASAKNGWLPVSTAG
ncbi:DUF4410 domain-containing protein [Paraburkholderia sp. J12]|uniref:DUF4410 domain-containing protein n=1 Tax=Paraburkholderia sp. J12 TaxID=2805432 RepID=UPI002ABE7C40|nr:DUF4410 domain-containing protein [Paraburkholderia sp. J12]